MKPNYIRLTCSILTFFLLAGCAAIYPTPPPPDYWPTDEWRHDDPSNRNIDAALLDAATEQIPDELPALDSLIIIRDGYVVHESYYNGYDKTTIHDVRSVTKSWTSALIGVAQANGKLTQIDAPLSELLPDQFANEQHEDKRDITLADLLAMRSGIEFYDEKLYAGEYGAYEELFEIDLTDFALSFPMAYEPGTAWNYSTLDSQLISAVFKQATGQALEAYAVDHLFEPLGITDHAWQADSTGTSIGGGGLSLTPRDMAKLGFLYLHQGEWDGEQIVPSDWVELSLTPQDTEAIYVPSGQTELPEWYGYHWWTWKGDWFYGYRAFVANGFGGQRIYVLPGLNLIIVTTANLDDVSPEMANMQEEGIDTFINEIVLPTLTEVDINER
ncbi:MAG: serine hydrolase [Ardenticatenaceae bacterium]|nr:serine hydrolase [Ardenticatenaceae bacterium]